MSRGNVPTRFLCEATTAVFRSAKWGGRNSLRETPEAGDEGGVVRREEWEDGGDGRRQGKARQGKARQGKVSHW